LDTGTKTGGHIVGKIQIVSGVGAYQGATGGGPFDGDWGADILLRKTEQIPIRNAEKYA
jgi:hypothetical protein